jgi:hypothetical protein
MHTSPSSLSCALGFIHHADISELPAIKESITASLIADMAILHKRPLTGDAMLDEIRSWVDEYRIQEKTADRIRMLKRIVSRQQNAGKPERGITTDMIERAREVDIKEVFESLVGTPIRNGMSSCPWHDDKNASFSMRRYNHFRCFSCGEKGSVIDFYMKQNGVGFSQAVRALLRI